MATYHMSDEMISDPPPAVFRSSELNSTSSAPLSSISNSVPQVEWLQPSIDNPPSSQSIRAYTEQMRMWNQSGPSHVEQRIYDDTPHILSSSARSKTSQTSASTPQTSRESSRSTINRVTMREGRPDSMLQLGKTFLARVKNQSKESSRSPSSLSGRGQRGEEEVDLRKKSILSTSRIGMSRSNSRSNLSFSFRSSSYESFPKSQISDPFDFQHVTHTVHQQAEGLVRKTSQADLLSEFTAVASSDAPTRKLKGIRVQNISDQDREFHRRPTTAHTYSKSYHGSRPTTGDIPSHDISSSEQHRLNHVQSFDNFGDLSPKKPSRKPSRDMLHIFKPSSRMHPVAVEENLSPISGRPRTASNGSRTPNGPPLPISLPTPVKHSTDDYFFQSHQSSSSTDTLWPLVSPPMAGTPQPLPKVSEEEVISPKHLHRNVKLYDNRSLPCLSGSSLHGFDLHTATNPCEVSSNTVPSSTSLSTPEDMMIGLAISPDERSVSISTMASDSVKVTITQDAWEDDIDYCYEHGIEASEDYEWEGSRRVSSLTKADTQITSSSTPMTTNSTPPTPNTPQLASTCLTIAPPRLSTLDFQSFTLSPSLLIPQDFTIFPKTASAPHTPYDHSHFPYPVESLPSQTPSLSRSSSTYSSRHNSPRLSHRNSGFSRSSHQSQATSSSRYSSRYSSTTWGSSTCLPRSQSHDMLVAIKDNDIATRYSVADISLDEVDDIPFEAIRQDQQEVPNSKSSPTTSYLPTLPPSPPPRGASFNKTSHHLRNESAPLQAIRPKTATSPTSTTKTRLRSRSTSLAVKKRGGSVGGYALFPST